MKSVAIIGAGPAGSETAYWLSRYGYNVSVYEEHPEAGKPVHCTGLISKNIASVIPLKQFSKFVLNRVYGAVFYSKHRKLELKTDSVQAYVIDRAKFDSWLAERARKAGANFFMNHKLFGIKQRNGKSVLRMYYNKKIVEKEADILIGADGPISKVANLAGMFGKRVILSGIQARVKAKFDKNHVQVYAGSVCPGFFAWVVPESTNCAKIGLASQKNTRNLFNKFISKFESAPGFKLISRHAGLIPIHSRVKLKKGRIYLVGDAAMQSKATTGGGVIMGMLSAKCLADSIRTKIPYRLMLAKVSLNLWLTKSVRQMLNRLNDKDYDSIVKIASKESTLKLLKEKGDMDYPAKLGIWLVLKEPIIFKYFFKALYNPNNKH
jgi:digeranylgeranylglycerophospholipid reductase